MKLNDLKDIITPRFPRIIPCTVWKNGEPVHEDGGSVQYVMKEYGGCEVVHVEPYIRDGDVWLGIDIK